MKGPRVSLRQLPVVAKRQIATAQLPVNYEAARTAILQCSRVDECKEWADRAAAIAVYAKQLRDNTMKEAAQRIQLRARVRIGELLLAIPNAQGRGNPGAGPDPGSRRQTIARNDLANTAIGCIAMARVPPRIREKLIEASPPISAKTLAGLGTRRRSQKEERFRAGSAYKLLVGIHNEGLGGFVRWIQRHSARTLARQIKADEASRLRDYIRAADDWLGELERNMKRGGDR